MAAISGLSNRGFHMTETMRVLGRADCRRIGPVLLSNQDLDAVAGGLNALMLPLAVVAATMAALDMDEYWIPYFSQKVIEADSK